MPLKNLYSAKMNILYLKMEAERSLRVQIVKIYKVIIDSNSH